MISREEWLRVNKNKIDKFVLESAKEGIEELNKIVGDMSLEKEIEQERKHIEEDLKYEPFNCIEEVNGINISPYLDEIRDKEYEHSLILLIKDNKVIKKFVNEGKYGYCDTNLEAFKEAENLEADIYHAHNHPCRYAAVPSGGYRKRYDKDWNVCYQETGDYDYFKNQLPKLAKEYKVKILDSGIVTDVNFYSVKQAGLFIKHDDRPH